MNIYINNEDIGRLVTGRDIGKLVAFYDRPEYVTYGILNEVNLIKDQPFIREGDYSSWRFARTLNADELRSLL